MKESEKRGDEAGDEGMKPCRRGDVEARAGRGHRVAPFAVQPGGDDRERGAKLVHRHAAVNSREHHEETIVALLQ